MNVSKIILLFKKMWKKFIRFLVNIKLFFFDKSINNTKLMADNNNVPAPDPAPVDPTPDQTPEDKAKELADSLKDAVSGVVVDVENLHKVIAFLNALKAKGYPTEESVVKMEERLKAIQDSIAEVNALLEPKVSDLKSLGDSLADDLPTL